jgi:hypothetical protein
MGSVSSGWGRSNQRNWKQERQDKLCCRLHALVSELLPGAIDRELEHLDVVLRDSRARITTESRRRQRR